MGRISMEIGSLVFFGTVSIICTTMHAPPRTMHHAPCGCSVHHAWYLVVATQPVFRCRFFPSLLWSFRRTESEILFFWCLYQIHLAFFCCRELLKGSPVYGRKCQKISLLVYLLPTMYLESVILLLCHACLTRKIKFRYFFGYCIVLRSKCWKK